MGLFGTLLRPGRIISGRRRRGKGVVEPSELRPLFPPPGATIRATVEQVAGSLGGRSEADSGGSRHGVVESGPGGDDADFLEIEQFARLKKLAHKPGPVLFAVLLLVSLVACRALLGGGALAGGALLPAPGDVVRPVVPVRRRLAPRRHRRYRERAALPRRPRRPVRRSSSAPPASR